MKLTRNETYAHNRCLELLKQDTLTDQEKEYILVNYHEGANHNNSAAGAFFTPIRMSFEFSNDVIMSINGDEITIIDLCAGIGMLSYPIITRLKNLGIKFRYVCIEYNREYLEVGQKLLPEAEWYCMDVCDWEEIKKLGHFDIAISNPPFGSVGTFRGKDTPRYKGSDAEYKVIDVAVFGVPNDDFGEEVKAVVQPREMPVDDEAAQVLAGELIQFCKNNIADVKCPRSIDFRSELPRHPTGKLYKRILKDEYARAAGRDAFGNSAN